MCIVLKCKCDTKHNLFVPSNSKLVPLALQNIGNRSPEYPAKSFPGEFAPGHQTPVLAEAVQVLVHKADFRSHALQNFKVDRYCM